MKIHTPKNYRKRKIETKDRWDKQKTNVKMLESNHISNHITLKWPNHPN